MISAVVPTYNRAHVLARALGSIAAQTRPPQEVWVVDDGSTDGTREVVAEFPGFHYLRQERRGVSAARNHGIAAANGEWIALLDSDDEWAPEKLALQMEALSGRSEVRVCHTDEIWIRNGRRVNPRHRHAKPHGWVFRECLPLCAISPSAALIHRSVLDRVGGFDEDLPACEDYDLWLRICSRFEVALVDRPLVIKHGGHSDQLSTTTWGLDRFRIRALEKILSAGVLGPEDRRLALETAIGKLEIFAAGAAKRGRTAEAQACLRRREGLRRELAAGVSA